MTRREAVFNIIAVEERKFTVGLSGADRLKADDQETLSLSAQRKGP